MSTSQNPSGEDVAKIEAVAEWLWEHYPIEVFRGSPWSSLKSLEESPRGIRQGYLNKAVDLLARIGGPT